MNRLREHSTGSTIRRREHPLGREPDGGSPRFAARIDQLAVTDYGPSHTQDEMLRMLGLEEDQFATGIFARCGVERRNLSITTQELERGLQERAKESEDMVLDMALTAVGQLDFDPADVSTVITASYSSLGGPTLAHRLVGELGLPPTTDKYHVLGIGCASSVPLFRMASQALLENPKSRALVVGVERLSGLMTSIEEGDERTKIVGSALFGDGCGAAILTRDADASGPALLSARVHQVEDTLDAVRFEVDGRDSYIHIGRELPEIARAGLGKLVDDFLAERGLARDRVAHWIVHPGGRGIIDGVQEGVGLDDDQVAVSRWVLANRGNVGTPSSMYVLDGIIRRNDPQPGDLGLAITIGPGVTVGLMLLRW